MQFVVFTLKSEVVRIWIMVVTWVMLQVVTLPRVDKEEISTEDDIEVIWLMDNPEEALPRFTSVCWVTVWMFDARATVTYVRKQIILCLCSNIYYKDKS